MVHLMAEYATRKKPTTKTTPIKKVVKKKATLPVPAMKITKPRIRPEEQSPERPSSSGYKPSELQGHAVRMAETVEHGPVQVIDIETGAILDHHPAELFLQDDVEHYYSHSTIKTLARCKAEAYYKKTGVKMRPAFSLERGSAAHNTLEAYIKYGTPVEEEFERQWTDLVLSKVDAMTANDQDKVRKLKEETIRMVTEFVEENDELIQSGQSESEVEFSVILSMPLGNGKFFKRRVFGKIDWIVFNHDKTKYRLFDFKSSAKAPPDEELDRDVQFTLYQHAATEMYGFPPEKIYFYLLRGAHLCRGDDGKAIRTSKAHPRTPECMQYAFEMPVKSQEEIDKIFATYYLPVIIEWEAGVIGKNLSDAHWCQTMCGYKDHCDKVTSFPLPRFVSYD